MARAGEPSDIDNLDTIVGDGLVEESRCENVEELNGTGNNYDATGGLSFGTLWLGLVCLVLSYILCYLSHSGIFTTRPRYICCSDSNTSLLFLSVPVPTSTASFFWTTL